MSFDAVFEQDLEHFRTVFPDGFADAAYFDRERQYKQRKHERALELLGRAEFEGLLAAEAWDETTRRIGRLQAATTNLLHSMEHTAFRDALNAAGAEREALARSLFDLLWGSGSEAERYTAWIDAVAALPQVGKSPVLTWPVVSALPFIVAPERHCTLKPRVARATAERYGVELNYRAAPDWVTYQCWMRLVDDLHQRLVPHGARDLLDTQSFIWVTRRYAPVAAR